MTRAAMGQEGSRDVTIRVIASEVIRLAEARNAESQAIDAELGIGDLGVDFASDQAWRLMMTPRPSEISLTSYLESLQPEAIFKLRTLMYCGRGDASDLFNFHVDLMRLHPNVESAIGSMVEKVPLPGYLQKGLELASRKRIDIEAGWPTTSTRTAPAPPKKAAAGKTVATSARTFPAGKDPVVDGAAIFSKIATEFVGDTIVAPAAVEQFFGALYQRTGGLVIVDFIDLGNWDQFDGYRFDVSTGYLELYWHDYRAADASGERSELDATVFPASLYGLVIRLQEIRIVRGKRMAAFLLCGHALDHSEIKAYLAQGSSEHKALPDNLFSGRFIRRLSGQVHVFDVLATPLYSVAIIPKGLHISTSRPSSGSSLEPGQPR